MREKRKWAGREGRKCKERRVGNGTEKKGQNGHEGAQAKMSNREMSRTFDVTMDLALAVKVFKCFQQLLGDHGNVVLVDRAGFHLGNLSKERGVRRTRSRIQKEFKIEARL